MGIKLPKALHSSRRIALCGALWTTLTLAAILLTLLLPWHAELRYVYDEHHYSTELANSTYALTFNQFSQSQFLSRDDPVNDCLARNSTHSCGDEEQSNTSPAPPPYVEDLENDGHAAATFSLRIIRLVHNTFFVNELKQKWRAYHFILRGYTEGFCHKYGDGIRSSCSVGENYVWRKSECAAFDMSCSKLSDLYHLTGIFLMLACLTTACLLVMFIIGCCTNYTPSSEKNIQLRKQANKPITAILTLVLIFIAVIVFVSSHNAAVSSAYQDSSIMHCGDGASPCSSLQGDTMTVIDNPDLISDINGFVRTIRGHSWMPCVLYVSLLIVFPLLMTMIFAWLPWCCTRQHHSVFYRYNQYYIHATTPDEEQVQDQTIVFLTTNPVQIPNSKLSSTYNTSAHREITDDYIVYVDGSLARVVETALKKLIIFVEDVGYLHIPLHLIQQQQHVAVGVKCASNNDIPLKDNSSDRIPVDTTTTTSTSTSTVSSSLQSYEIRVQSEHEYQAYLIEKCASSTNPSFSAQKHGSSNTFTKVIHNAIHSTRVPTSKKRVSKRTVSHSRRDNDTLDCLELMELPHVVITNAPSLDTMVHSDVTVVNTTNTSNARLNHSSSDYEDANVNEKQQMSVSVHDLTSNMQSFHHQQHHQQQQTVIPVMSTSTNLPVGTMMPLPILVDPLTMYPQELTVNLNTTLLHTLPHDLPVSFGDVSLENHASQEYSQDNSMESLQSNMAMAHSITNSLEVEHRDHVNDHVHAHVNALDYVTVTHQHTTTPFIPETPVVPTHEVLDHTIEHASVMAQHTHTTDLMNMLCNYHNQTMLQTLPMINTNIIQSNITSVHSVYGGSSGCTVHTPDTITTTLQPPFQPQQQQVLDYQMSQFASVLFPSSTNATPIDYTTTVPVGEYVSVVPEFTRVDSRQSNLSMNPLHGSHDHSNFALSQHHGNISEQATNRSHRVDSDASLVGSIRRPGHIDIPTQCVKVTTTPTTTTPTTTPGISSGSDGVKQFSSNSCAESSQYRVKSLNYAASFINNINSHSAGRHTNGSRRSSYSGSSHSGNSRGSSRSQSRNTDRHD